ncbi:hypothetical protein T484DRAFT_3642957, partial [Baffinella frigidus]
SICLGASSGVARQRRQLLSSAGGGRDGRPLPRNGVLVATPPGVGEQVFLGDVVEREVHGGPPRGAVPGGLHARHPLGALVASGEDSPTFGPRDDRLLVGPRFDWLLVHGGLQLGHALGLFALEEAGCVGRAQGVRAGRRRSPRPPVGYLQRHRKAVGRAAWRRRAGLRRGPRAHHGPLKTICEGSKRKRHPAREEHLGLGAGARDGERILHLG